MPENEEETEEFQATCDQCGCNFSSKTPIWDDYDQINDRFDKLTIIFNPTGYHDQWFCSRNCHLEATQQVAKAVKDKYGETCTKCNRKTGTWSMRPCNVCDKIICTHCEIDDNKSSRFCSQECQNTVKHCTKCNTLVPKEDPDLCEYCQKRKQLGHF